MKIIYTTKAINDLERLRAFIARDNPRAANEIATNLVEVIDRLLEFPLMGRKIKKQGLELRNLVIQKYVIRYIVSKNKIFILRIWHGKEKRPFSLF